MERYLKTARTNPLERDPRVDYNSAGGDKEYQPSYFCFSNHPAPATWCRIISLPSQDPQYTVFLELLLGNPSRTR